MRKRQTPKKRKHKPRKKVYSKKTVRPQQKESILIIDQFNTQDLERWQLYKDKLLNYQAEFYTVLNRQRSEIYPQLKQSLLNAATKDYYSDSYNRVVHAKFSNNPLSSKGSVLNDPGGRFNIGAINENMYETFPALYLASSKQTAIIESFCGKNENDLSFALDVASNFSCFKVEVKLDTILSLKTKSSLKEFCGLIKNFRLPDHLASLAKEIGYSAPNLVYDLDTLMESVLDPTWRKFPMQFDIPANCQILGKIAMDAGIDAILYPSVKSKEDCLALFPKNIDSSTGSYVKIIGDVQETLKYRELTASNHAEVFEA